MTDNMIGEQFMSPEIGSLALALSKAQREIRNVAKDKNGYNYKYAELSSCLDVIREPFAKNGLAISQLIIGNDSLLTLVLHESGQWLKARITVDNQITPTKGINELQSFGSKISYMRRYSICSITGLASEDDDGVSSSVSPKPTMTSQSSSRSNGGIIQPKTVKAAIDNVIPMDANISSVQTNPYNILVKELKKLCDEFSVDMKDFGKFHGLNSQDADFGDQLKETITNFHFKLGQFNNPQKLVTIADDIVHYNQ